MLSEILGAIPLVSSVVRWWKRPKLFVRFERNQTYQESFDQSVGQFGMFLHLMVRNEGKTNADKCEALVLEINEQDDKGNFSPCVGYKGPVKLHWAHQPLDCFEIDVDTDFPRRLDVCYVHKNDSNLHLFCERFPRGEQIDFTPGTYEFKIRVSAKNAKNTYATVVVKWSGHYPDIKMKQVS